MSQKAVEKKIGDGNAVAFKKAFSSFSVNDLEKAKEFYGKTLSLPVTESEESLELQFENGQNVFIYPKSDHQPATFTVLNLQVDDIDKAVDDITARNIKLESYEGEMKTDEKGIFRGGEKGNGPNIAWFKDPAGNYLSLIETR